LRESQWSEATTLGRPRVSERRARARGASYSDAENAKDLLRARAEARAKAT